MSELAKENGFMTKEHLSIEERQVARAIEEARGATAGRDWPTSVETLRSLGKIEAEKPAISPSVEAVRSVVNLMGETEKLVKYDDPYKGIAEKGVGLESLMSPEERERMAREQRAEYTKGSWLVELIRTSDNPDAIRMATRMFIAVIEANDEVPDIQAIDHVRKFLADRAMTYKAVAKDPEFAKKMGMEKFGLVEKKIKVLVREEINPGKLWRIPVKEKEAELLAEILHVTIDEKDGLLSVLITEGDLAELHGTKEGGAIWNKTEERIIPASFTRKQLEELAEVCEKASDELAVRRKVFTADILYGGSNAQLGRLCGLWVDGRYSGIGDKDWKTFVSLGELKEGEAKFGDKMETGLRILTLIGEGGGGARFFGVPREFRNREEEERVARSGRERRLREVVRIQPAEIRNLFADGARFQKLVDSAQENLFCDLPRDASAIENVKKWLVDVVNDGKGDKDDTKAAVDCAWRLFFMWGIARQFDCRVANDGRFEPRGVPATDDIVKLKFFNEAREKDRAKGHPHGPDATMGEFPKGFSTINFLEYAKPKSDRTSFWEQWWKEGKPLKDLNWENAGNSWFRYNESLFNFAGDPEGKGDNVYKMLMKPVDRVTDLVGVDKLRSLVKMLDKASFVWPEGVDKIEMKKIVVGLVFYGNIATTFQNVGEDGWKEWGVPLPGRFSGSDAKEYAIAVKNNENMFRIVKQVGLNIDKEQLDQRLKEFCTKNGIKIK